MENSEKSKKISLLLEDLISLEDYVHDLFNFSPLPVCLVSPSGILLEVNPAFEKISGFDFDEIVGEPLSKIFESERIERLKDEVLDGKLVEAMEMKIFSKGGKSLSVQAFAQARKDEKAVISGFFLSVFDLSKIKETEAELRKSQTALLNILEDTEEARRKAEEEREKTEAIINNFADGLLVFDKSDYLILINPEAEDYLGVENKDVVGKLISELAKMPQFFALAGLLEAKNKKLFREELELNKDKTVNVSTIEIKRQKKETGYFIVLHDVSREKIVEKLKTEFVSISAHQLRTPLSAIKWTLRMLLDGDMGKINKEQKEFLQRTYRSNERMISLVNSLLNVTRIEEGRFVFNPKQADIYEIVKSAIDSCKEEVKKRKIKIDLQKPKNKLSKVVVDEEKIQLAFQNLIDNSIKYSFPGKKIEINFKKKKQAVETIIKDYGIGVPKNQQQRIFTKFFRGSNVMRLDTDGTGLGLFIVKNIIDAHKGKIWFKSEEDKGITFWVSLPISAEKKRRQKKES